MVSSAHYLLWVMAANTLPCCLHATGCDWRQPETCEESAFLQAGLLHLSEPEVSLPLVPTKCALPEGGTWAMVQIPGVKPYWLAVHAKHDVVSRHVMRHHNWENFIPGNYGAPGHAVDIGANLGFYTFALAKSGWNVTSFEPMPANRALFKASLCANPDVVEQIDLHEHGLGDANQHCYLISPNNNIGDGFVSCGNDTNPEVKLQGTFGAYHSRGEFDVKIFDDIENNMFAQHKVDFVKIDVEGYECHVFRGAKKLLAQKPRKIQTEINWEIAGCTPSDYAQMFLA